MWKFHHGKINKTYHLIKFDKKLKKFNKNLKICKIIKNKVLKVYKKEQLINQKTLKRNLKNFKLILKKVKKNYQIVQNQL